MPQKTNCNCNFVTLYSIFLYMALCKKISRNPLFKGLLDVCLVIPMGFKPMTFRTGI